MTSLKPPMPAGLVFPPWLEKKEARRYNTTLFILHEARMEGGLPWQVIAGVPTGLFLNFG